MKSPLSTSLRLARPEAPRQQRAKLQKLKRQPGRESGQEVGSFQCERLLISSGKNAVQYNYSVLSYIAAELPRSSSLSYVFFFLQFIYILIEGNCNMKKCLPFRKKGGANKKGKILSQYELPGPPFIICLVPEPHVVCSRPRSGLLGCIFSLLIIAVELKKEGKRSPLMQASQPDKQTDRQPVNQPAR